MAIKDLKAKQGNADVTGTITEISPPREFNKFGKAGRVANAVLKDDTGQIKLSLWNEQIEQVKVGDKVHITNGYVNEWQGELQLTTGKFGSLEVIGSSSGDSGEEVTVIGEQPAELELEEALEELGDAEEEDLDIDEEDIG